MIFEQGPPLPGKYTVYAFLTESDDAVVGSSAMFECVGAFDANQARQARFVNNCLYICKYGNYCRRNSDTRTDYVVTAADTNIPLLFPKVSCANLDSSATNELRHAVPAKLQHSDEQCVAG